MVGSTANMCSPMSWLTHLTAIGTPLTASKDGAGEFLTNPRLAPVTESLAMPPYPQTFVFG